MAGKENHWFDRGIMLVAFITIVVQYFYIFPNIEYHRESSLSGTYKIDEDGRRTMVELSGPEYTRGAVIPGWSTQWSIILVVVNVILSLSFLVILFRLVFTPARFHCFWFGYLQVMAMFLFGLGALGTVIVFHILHIEKMEVLQVNSCCINILFAMILWQRLRDVSDERSVRTLEAVEVK